jgi:RNA polymerase sigma-70 factor (ECF subfamily)
VSALELVRKKPARASEPGAEPLEAVDPSILYQRYHLEVFHLALRYGRGDVGWAEDVTHDVFVQLVQRPERLYAHESLSGWFYRVTTNRCLNRLRRDALRRSLSLGWLLAEQGSSPRTPEVVLIAKDELGRAFEAVNLLPIKERLAFFMHHVDGKTQSEIANILDHSSGYVCKLLKRAAERLRAAGWEVGP